MSERRARGPLQRVQRRSRELRAQVAGLHRAGYRGCTGAGTGDVPGPVPGVSAPDRPRPLLQVEALRAESAAVAPGQREALWLRWGGSRPPSPTPIPSLDATARALPSPSPLIPSVVFVLSVSFSLLIVQLSSRPFSLLFSRLALSQPSGAEDILGKGRLRGDLTNP